MILLTFVLSEVAMAGTISLPRTGQTKCYDSAGNQIPCVGTGQDGEIQAGVAWPNPRFTVNADTSITDNLTGLVWAPNGNLMQTRDPGFDNDGTAGDGRVTWYHEMDYVEKLNNESYLGHGDWRLPNVNELESLVNADVPNSATWLNSQGFTNVQSYYYWSSTTYAYDTDYAWIVNMNVGDVLYGFNKSYSFIYAWPVRAGQ